MIVLTTQQQKVLEALSTYGYLTIHQMLNLHISKNAHSLRNHSLNRLINTHRKAINSHDFGWIPQKGRLSKIYYLTRTGAELLAEATQQDFLSISYPKGGVQFSSDYSHRINFIDFHIAFRQWAKTQKKDINFFHSYFDKIGNQRYGQIRSQSKTRVLLNKQAFIPDGMTQYQDNDKTRLVAIEIHNGVHSRRITNQLLSHIETLEYGLFSKKYQHKTANFILSIHENKSTLHSVKRRMLQVLTYGRFESLKPLFLFNLQSRVQIDFIEGWTLVDEGKTALF